MKAITLYDVALLAGVSYQTVSRVINDAEHVSARTREKVQQAMAELHYVPNLRAQQLAGKRTRTLGLITTDLALHAPSQIVSAVKSRAAEQGASVLISMVEQPQQCQAALQALLAQRVDALLVNVPLDDEHAEQLRALASPVPVLFLDVSPSAQVNSLVFNAVQGAHLGVEHLLSLGHQRIALLSGPESSVSARARLAGWKAALARAGHDAAAVAYGDWSAASGYEKGHVLLSGAALPDAILVANDQMALGVLSALAQLNRSGSQAVSVTGYDDTADSLYFQPPLTTVAQDFDLLGKRAVERLIALMAAPQLRIRELLPTRLIVRQSAWPLAAAEDRQQTLAQLKALVEKL